MSETAETRILRNQLAIMRVLQALARVHFAKSAALIAMVQHNIDRTDEMVSRTGDEDEHMA